MNSNPDTIPVIVGVGEYVDRPESIALALEPLALIERAVREACADSGGDLLGQVDSVELVGLVTWRYENPVGLLCERLGIGPERQVNASMGGETPIRLIHEAALRIVRGEQRVALVVGGEAVHSRKKARKEGVKLNWTTLAGKDSTVRYPNDSIEISPVSKAVGIVSPVEMYPLYEMAAEAKWGQSPREGRIESAALWAEFAHVASENPYAWIGRPASAEEIAEIGPQNRMISWPYPKLMVANPTVNQASAVLVTSLANARAAGIPEDRMVHIWGGAAAAEPANYLYRDRYDHSTAQAAALAEAVALAGGDARQFGKLELYSCFPVVPKMALRAMGIESADCRPTVTGGLTFFGGPLNNYMGHAVCSMVHALRAAPGELGLLYGQGGFVSKHHALVVSTMRSPHALKANYSVQDEADRMRGAVPALVEGYQGPATIETYTVLYGSDGEPLHGVVVVRTPEGARTMGRVCREDDESMALLLSLEQTAVGASGHIRTDAFGKPVWEAGPLRDRKTRAYRHVKVERDGPLTIVTINRPEVMNALTPFANAELAEIFDDFAEDSSQLVAILTGAGDRAFCSGNDLRFTAKALARGDSIRPPLSGYAGLTSRFDLTKPVIAAVNGVAMGGGFEIALACDLVIASENAVFALPEPRVGLAAVAGGLLRLPRQIGYKQAMGMILTGRRVSAEEGRTLGFVNEVTAEAELMATARRWAEQIIECSPKAIQASKQIVQCGLEEESLEAAYRAQNRYPALLALYQSSDMREGPLAFAEKRPPQWQK